MSKFETLHLKLLTSLYKSTFFEWNVKEQTGLLSMHFPLEWALYFLPTCTVMSFSNDDISIPFSFKSVRLIRYTVGRCCYQWVLCTLFRWSYHKPMKDKVGLQSQWCVFQIVFCLADDGCDRSFYLFYPISRPCLPYYQFVFLVGFGVDHCYLQRLYLRYIFCRYS